MPKPSKNLTDRVLELEKKLAAFERAGATACNPCNVEAHSSDCDCLHAANEPLFHSEGCCRTNEKPPCVGTLGTTLPLEQEEQPGVDQFLFNIVPDMLGRLRKSDMEAADIVTNWLLRDDTVKDFYLLWFAGGEEARAYLLFTVVLKNMPLSTARFDIMRNTIAENTFNEVKKAYERVVAEAAAAKQARVQQPPLSSLAKPAENVSSVQALFGSSLAQGQ